MEVGAGGGEGAGDAEPDAPAGGGDEHRLPLEIGCHRSAPAVRRTRWRSSVFIRKKRSSSRRASERSGPKAPATSISETIRAGRCEKTTMRSARNTASSTSWVTKMMVL